MEAFYLTLYRLIIYQDIPEVVLLYILKLTMVCSSLVTVLLGICMEPVIQFSMVAAGQLMDPQVYINAVLGGHP